MTSAEFDPVAVAGSIDAALTGPHFVTAVRPLVAGLEGDDPLRPRLFPIEYRLDDESGSYVPIWEGADGSIHPPYIESLDATTVEDWAAIADALSEPAGRARYHDVLWVARHRNAADHARLAIEGYQEAAGQDRWNSILPTEWLRRSLHLAKSISASDLVASVTEQMMQRGLAALEAEGPKPGVVLGFLRPLVGLEQTDRPAGLEDALARASELFSDSAFLAEEIMQLRARLVGIQSEAGRALLLEAVDMIIADAERSDSGLRRRALLDQALQFATLHGLTEVHDGLVSSIQAITADDLDLQTVTAEVEVEREPIDRIVAQLSGGDDWAEVIRRIAAFGPLVGQPADRIAEATAQMQEFPLAGLLSSVVIGQFGETIFRPTTDEERLDFERVKLETISLQFWATILADALGQAHERLGDPDETVVAAAFEAVWCPPEIAAKLARSLCHYFAGDFDESVLVALPRIEAIVRNLAREAGVAIIRNPHSNHRNGVRTLGDLLFGGLQDVLEEHLHRHLDVVLIKPTGLNIRNNHLHGLVIEGDRVAAALLIHTAAVLTHLQKSSAADAS